MTASIGTAPLLLIFSTNHRLLTRALDGLSDAHFRTRAGERTNSVAWVSGHIIQTRASMLGRLGESFTTGWGNTFDRGAELPDPSAYPSPQSMLLTAQQIDERLQARLTSLSDAALADAAAGTPLPGVKTVAEQLGFFALHDSYHVGQLGYMRKALGYPSLVG